VSTPYERVRYFATSLNCVMRGVRLNCPACGADTSEVVERKWFVTALRRCKSCQLMFRTPTPDVEREKKFYAQRYRQGVTTELPSTSRLQELKSENFAAIGKNYDRYIEVIEALGAKSGVRLFDFGCSWGYGSWQFAQRGYVVDAFELPGPRAQYAREQLGVNVVASLGEIEAQSYDFFFSSHVLEHVPNVSETISKGMNSLRPGGYFVAFVPNGSFTRRAIATKAWSKSWGLVHPNLLDERYAFHRFPNEAIYIGSNPYHHDRLEAWRGADTRVSDALDGEELLIAVRKAGTV
jgi:SAM-dependent methyltransferase